MVAFVVERAAERAKRYLHMNTLKQKKQSERSWHIITRKYNNIIYQEKSEARIAQRYKQYASDVDKSDSAKWKTSLWQTYVLSRCLQQHMLHGTHNPT